MFDTKETSWKVILGYLLASLCITALINLILFPGPFFDPISKATFNLIDPTLQANLLNILIFSLIVFGWGKLHPSDVGLEWHKLAQGLSLTVLIWLIVQAIILLINWDNGDIHLDPIWSKYGVTTVLGGLIAQLAGNALIEEIEFRGFYLRQFYLKLKIPDERWRVGWAAILMAGLFVLSHIPSQIYYRFSLSEMLISFASLFFLGLILALIYLLSGNLFFTIGIHALMNQPTLITEIGFPAGFFVLFLGLFFTAFLWTKKHTVTVDLFSPNAKGKE